MPSLASLASALDPRVNESRGDVILTVLRRIDDSPKTQFSFQYFPETITDDKEVSFNAKDIPGASLPLQQWISGGARTISFTAFFTADRDLLAQGRAKAAEIRQLLQQAGVERRSIDVRTALAFLGHLQAPSYDSVADTGAAIAQAPPKLVLTIPNSGIGVTRGFVSKQTALPDSIICYLTSAPIEYQAFFPSGLPRIASTQLTFTEIPQYGGQINFPQGAEDSILSGIAFGGGNELYPYPVRPRRGKGN